ncbi:hypothetical protein HanPSC8_Chr15g0685331 [Helianthus annuus]|nr:hypothetical protein HanPSC8_Chr15g0685331 [Helianthus annuus]
MFCCLTLTKIGSNRQNSNIQSTFISYSTSSSCIQTHSSSFSYIQITITLIQPSYEQASKHLA